MGSLLYFLVLAIVSFTGKVVASSHNARRKRVIAEGDTKKVETPILDEKKVIHDRLNGEISPSLPMFRLRRTLLGHGVYGLLEGGLKEKESLLTQRENLKKTLKIVIPGGEVLSLRPEVTEIPPSFNFYSEKQEHFQSSSGENVTPPRRNRGTSSDSFGVSGACVAAHSSDGNRFRMRPRGIARVGVLKAERMENPFRACVSAVNEVT